jgi:hypothetical protein
VLDKEAFGRFSVVYLGVVLAMSAIRPVTGEVLLLPLLPSADGDNDGRVLRGRAAG